jgi:predicted dinucleotide-binding enzyme
MNIDSTSISIFRQLVSKTGALSRYQAEAISSSNIIVIAVPKDFYTSLPADALAGKIVVDVSNRSTSHRKMTM